MARGSQNPWQLFLVTPHPRGAAAKAGRPRPNHQHEREASHGALFSKGAASKESKRRRFPTWPRAVSDPYTFGILKQTTLPVFTPSKEGLTVADAPELEVEWRSSFRAMFSFLRPRHERDHLESRSSTNSGALISRSEDGEVVESRYQDRSRFPPSQTKADATTTSTTHHGAGYYFPIV